MERFCSGSWHTLPWRGERETMETGLSSYPDRVSTSLFSSGSVCVCVLCVVLRSASEIFVVWGGRGNWRTVGANDFFVCKKRVNRSVSGVLVRAPGCPGYAIGSFSNKCRIR